MVWRFSPQQLAGACPVCAPSSAPIPPHFQQGANTACKGTWQESSISPYHSQHHGDMREETFYSQPPSRTRSALSASSLGDKKSSWFSIFTPKTTIFLLRAMSHGLASQIPEYSLLHVILSQNGCIKCRSPGLTQKRSFSLADQSLRVPRHSLASCFSLNLSFPQ